MRVAASIRAPNVNVLVARIHDNIAGFAIMRYGDDDAHLDLLAVSPPYRRAGVGRQLLNEGAQLFYKRIGYRTLVHLPDYYQGIEAALRMGRDLSRRPLDHRICCPRPKSSDVHSMGSEGKS